MKFPNQVQSVLLFERRFDALEAVARAFLRAEELRHGHRFNVSEANPGLFYRLYGGDDLMVTLEYMDSPAQAEPFRQAIASPITRLLAADMPERLARHRSHVIVNVSHGVLPDMPEVAGLLAELGMPQAGASLPQFTRRLEALAALTQLALDEQPASAIHWTQSNQLIDGARFETFAAAGVPGPLHVHPFLFAGPAAGGREQIEVMSFGMRHFLGGEITIPANPLPWHAHYEAMLAFLRVATTRAGYVIPDGDCFGPEDRSYSYRVRHQPGDAGQVPMFELTPLVHREFGFQSPDYVPERRTIDDTAPPPALMPESPAARATLLGEWREKRALAEGIGGRFEVRARNPDLDGPAPGRGLFGRRLFGRKAAN